MASFLLHPHCLLRLQRARDYHSNSFSPFCQFQAEMKEIIFFFSLCTQNKQSLDCRRTEVNCFSSMQSNLTANSWEAQNRSASSFFTKTETWRTVISFSHSPATAPELGLQKTEANLVYYPTTQVLGRRILPYSQSRLSVTGESGLHFYPHPNHQCEVQMVGSNHPSISSVSTVSFRYGGKKPSSLPSRILQLWLRPKLAI